MSGLIVEPTDAQSDRHCLAIATLMAAACASPHTDNVTLVSVSDASNDQAGGSLTVKPNTPYEFPIRNVCTRNGKPIQITKVTPWRPTGTIKIVDWGVRDHIDGTAPGLEIGSEAMTVSKIGGFTTGPVPATCNAKHELDEFYISVSTSTVRSSLYGANLYYGHGKMVHNQFAIRLCLTKNCPIPHLDGGS